MSDDAQKTDNEFIIVLHEGVEVKGKFTHRSSRDMSISILSPYTGFRTGIHTPYFSPKKSSFMDDSGLEVAKNLLLNLYLNIEKFESLKPKMIEPYQQLLKETSLERNMIQKLEEDLVQLKKKMKSKVITPVEYQRAITPIKKELEHNSFSLQSREGKFIDEWLALRVDSDFKKECIKDLSRT